MEAIVQFADTFDALWTSRPRDVKIAKQVARDAFLGAALDSDKAAPVTDTAARNYDQHNARKWWANMGTATGHMINGVKVSGRLA
jgi:hypothetical protein